MKHHLNTENLTVGVLETKCEHTGEVIVNGIWCKGYLKLTDTVIHTLKIMQIFKNYKLFLKGKKCMNCTPFNHN